MRVRNEEALTRGIAGTRARFSGVDRGRMQFGGTRPTVDMVGADNCMLLRRSVLYV